MSTHVVSWTKILVCIVLTSTFLVCTHSTPSQRCDRECLETYIDQYLNAVITHDPGHLPFTAHVKFTENGQRLEPGDGLWNTASARGSYSLYFADETAGQIGFFGTIRESNVPAIIAIRLKIEQAKISEIETLVARDSTGAIRLEALPGPHPSFLENIPESQQTSRDELIRIANMYFTGLEQNDGKGDYPFADRCNRIENGMQTTNKPGDNPIQFDITALTCKQQFESGFFRFVTRIRDRRFIIVDQPRGVVFAFAFFDHAGNVPAVTLTNGMTIPISVKEPWTWEIAEIFKIKDGLFQQIEAVCTRSPYGMNSGWSNWGDGLSSRIQH
ncbi:hypothetical protein JW960_16605 [candidate division KSB1 bacterium]|nr:hypothetical protein [candidate division KSB1 bacterium]